MITLLFYIINIIKILSYIPTEFTISPLNYSPYLRDTCTCDLTYKVCDRNCGCDPFCDFSKYGFFDDFFEEYVESNVILPESVNSVPICSAEHYVIGDLYNPLSVGYQILKKGMCLKKKDQEFDIIENPEKIKDIISTEQIDSENMKKFFLQTPVSNSFNDNYQNIEYFVFPVMAPSGMCMEGYPIKPGEDKTVICSIQGNNLSDFNTKVNDYINPPNNMITNFTLYENNIYENRNDTNDTNIIKKIIINIEINEQNDLNFCNNNNQCKYHYYYRNISENNARIISDVTFVIKFFVFDSEFNVLVPKKSGNPGYIIGSPIRFGEKKDNYIYPFYRSRLFLGLNSSNNNCVERFTINNNDIFYEDLILSNSITFENRTLFTCYLNKEQNSNLNSDSTLIKQVIYGYFTQPNYILEFGNSMISDSNDITINLEQKDGTYNYFIVNIFYQYVGLKQNPQRKIKRVECNKAYIIENDNAVYIEFLFINQNVELKKEEVPAPIIIKWPHNWLYPFRIGTTNYEEK